MFEKIKKMFNEKDEKKKTENLVAFLIILVVTLIFVNKILGSDSKSNEEMYKNKTGMQLVNSKAQENAVLVENEGDNLEENLKKILSKINGVGRVDVLITYQKDNPLKIEGAIVTAEGGGNVEIKKNLILAVEAATRTFKS